MTDLEMEAMISINDAMKELEPDAARRVLRWAADKFAKPEEVFDEPERQNGGADGAAPSAREYSHMAELVSAAAPKTDVERTLVATYWYQEILGNEFVTAQEVNAELKQLGHHVKNITDAYSGLIDRKPQWGLQMGKSGNSRQARKRYKLTAAGINQVKQMIAASHNGDE